MVQKIEAKGGKGGNQWDDRSDNDDVTKIQVQGGREGIQFIKFDYVKNGQSILGPIHGVSSRGFTQTFKTNTKTSDIFGYDEGTKFSISAHGKKIIGFHGFAEKNLNSLGAYFIRMPSIKSAIQGGITTGNVFDDGGDYDGIRSIYVTFNGEAINHIVVHYDKAGQVETRKNGYSTGTEYEVRSGPIVSYA